MKVKVMGINSFDKLDFKASLKSLTVSYIVTFIILMVLSVLLTYTPMSINFANIGVLATVCVSTFFGGYYVSKKAQSKGLINGALAGFLYIVVLYMVGALLYGKFGIEKNMILTAVISVLSGAFGGVVGVNSKK